MYAVFSNQFKTGILSVMQLTRRSLIVAVASTLLQRPAFARHDIGPEWITGHIPDSPYNIDLINLRMVPE
jgi:hypothetical protein